MQYAATTTEHEMSAVLDKLFAVLKSWAVDMDPFRYSMFYRRLIAAEHGRADAVQWALDWFYSTLEEEAAAEAARAEKAQRMARDTAHQRAEFHAGRCSNPHYQAFLDTVEHPEAITHHCDYMAWIAMIESETKYTAGYRELSAAAQKHLWQSILIAKRDANLAPRLKGQPHRLPFEKA